VNLAEIKNAYPAPDKLVRAKDDASGRNATITFVQPLNGLNSSYTTGSVTLALKFYRNADATASVADGGTINHLLTSTPTYVQATPSVASEMASVTAVAATTFTVAIKKHDNSAGTSQTIYWEAQYKP